VWIDLSTFCNASCPQCHRTSTQGLGKVEWLPLMKWSLADFKRKFPAGSIDNVNSFNICGTWGDPVMSKDLAKICYHIIDHSKACIQINTNGGIRSPKWWENMGNYCGERLTVYFDVDGIDNEMHQKYRRGVDLEVTLENMEALSNTPAKAYSFIIMFKHNEDYLQQIVYLCKLYGSQYEYIIKSDRFLTNNIFKFINEKGEEEVLEEADPMKVNHRIKNAYIDKVSDKFKNKICL